MKFAVITFPGSNCDYDCYRAVKDHLKCPVEYIWHREHSLNNCDCVILPGGFSYGDYLRTGAIARFSPIMQEVMDFAEQGGPVIGICNGFQILLESGLLPGAMLVNRSLQFICQTVHLKVENNKLPFTNKLTKDQLIRVPIAHKEGNYYADEKTVRELEDGGRVVFRYSDAQGRVDDSANPNGSVNNIAGITNKKGNVMGMMPHPERAMEQLLGSSDGVLIFDSIQNFLGAK
ncbi:MAG: phosphoribosylformylglycinamidine synthase subunit PurQ [Candidatus Edwardsbacteria bacterium]|nr:phosphoribosylformylglycinamidine synthase subunit PurQ [Candidatus Edwardsbacteria bacterium]MBU1575998.1 phosphoribosylformylglycinamidine synthase subunit PurQ [Candidatus Edwardsbacteria bacterium]MBU2463608.1 phosphoribosylformylglycinamidine synthase subunit PurQ [Candidatus Edwardsbacteria bacterium]MBU2593720.1 phosphoribosylformylglycinamidine synthase subunit PurQ [Candidatus Edwardsbacteria bacterium]